MEAATSKLDSPNQTRSQAAPTMPRLTNHVQRRLLERRSASDKIDQATSRRQSILNNRRDRLARHHAKINELAAKRSTMGQYGSASSESQGDMALGRLSDWQRMGLDLSSIRAQSFNETAELLQKPQVLSVSMSLLAELSSKKAKQADVRVFLMAYMMCAHPDSLFNHADDGAKKILLRLAQDMISAVELYLQRPHTHAHSQAKSQPLAAFREFRSVFSSWAERDRKALLDRLVESYVELERLWLSVKGTAAAECEWQPKILQEQEQLRKQLRMAGRESGIVALEQRLSQLHADFEDAARQRCNIDVSGPPTNNVPDESSVDQVTSSLASTLAVSDDIVRLRIVHELFLDPDFDHTKLVRVGDEQHFVDSLDRLTTTIKALDIDNLARHADAIVAMVGIMKEMLLKTAVNEGPTKQSIEDAIDLELIGEQLVHGHFDLFAFFTSTIDTMAGLCAPTRDSEIKQLYDYVNSHELVQVVSSLFMTLRNMNADVTNFSLKVIRPHLQQIAVEYEQRAFQKILAGNKLRRTTEWLQEAIATLLAAQNASDPESPPVGKQSSETILVEAILHILVACPEELPETQLLDRARLNEFAAELDYMAGVASTILVLNNAFPAHRRDISAADRLIAQVKAIMREQQSEAVECLQAIITELAQDNHVGTVPIRRYIHRLVDDTEPVFKLMKRRIIVSLRNHLRCNSANTDVSIAAQGLGPVVPEIQKFADKVHTFVKFHRAVHAPIYDRILLALQDPNRFHESR